MPSLFSRSQFGRACCVRPRSGAACCVVVGYFVLNEGFVSQQLPIARVCVCVCLCVRLICICVCACVCNCTCACVHVCVSISLCVCVGGVLVLACNQALCGMEVLARAPSRHCKDTHKRRMPPVSGHAMHKIITNRTLKLTTPSQPYIHHCCLALCFSYKTHELYHYRWGGSHNCRLLEKSKLAVSNQS